MFIDYLSLESFLSGGWNNVWVVLYQDSSICVYKRQGDYEIKAKAFMKVTLIFCMIMWSVFCIRLRNEGEENVHYA